MYSLNITLDSVIISQRVIVGLCPCVIIVKKSGKCIIVGQRNRLSM